MKIQMIFKIIVSILIISLILIITGAIFFINLNKTPGKIKNVITFSIRKGESVNSIANRLEEEQIINSALLLKLVCKVIQTETRIKAGNYHIPVGASTIDIYNIFISGKEEFIKITIPEGWTLKKIAHYLQEKKILLADEFIMAAHSKELLEKFAIPADNFEGYLFPDTYFFSEGLSGTNVIDNMVANFYKNLKLIVPDYEKTNKNKIFEKIIMASIIEREYRVDEEAVLIASVFYNRLQYRIGLESCATLEYIITDIMGQPHPEYISLSDKQIDSPYNTYKWYGLPPGPISNPGKTAIHAAFYPAKTDFWYFVLKDKNSGRHYFSKDLEEHINAKFYFLKGYGASP